MRLISVPFVALVAVALPAFFQGCSCSDHVDVKSAGAPKGGTMPSTGTINDDPLGPVIYNGLDPKTCTNDATAPQIEPPIYLAPSVAGTGGRPYVVLVWSFCNPGRNDLSAQPNYQLLVSPDSAVRAQVAADPDCRTRPRGNDGFPVKCFPPIPGNDRSITIGLPALTSCMCHSEIVFVNVPASQEGAVSTKPPTQRMTVPSGDFHFTLSSPWDVTILDQEVVLQ